jgi:hypothetical protein
MFNKLVLFLSLATFALITGCATAPPPLPPVVKTIVVAPDESKLVDCIPAPIFASDYVKASPEDKNRILFEALMDSYTSMAKCNVRWNQLRVWTKAQRELYVDK